VYQGRFLDGKIAGLFATRWDKTCSAICAAYSVSWLKSALLVLSESRAGHLAVRIDQAGCY